MCYNYCLTLLHVPFVRNNEKAKNAVLTGYTLHSVEEFVHLHRLFRSLSPKREYATSASVYLPKALFSIKARGASSSKIFFNATFHLLNSLYIAAEDRAR